MRLMSFSQVNKCTHIFSSSYILFLKFYFMRIISGLCRDWTGTKARTLRHQTCSLLVHGMMRQPTAPVRAYVLFLKDAYTCHIILILRHIFLHIGTSLNEAASHNWWLLRFNKVENLHSTGTVLLWLLMVCCLSIFILWIDLWL